jgi:hypothetical protein
MRRESNRRRWYRLLRRDSLHALREKHMDARFRYRAFALGDQDVYTLLSFEHPDLFYRLPCVWNRQLCTAYIRHAEDLAFYHCDGDGADVLRAHENSHTRTTAAGGGGTINVEFPSSIVCLCNRVHCYR